MRATVLVGLAALTTVGCGDSGRGSEPASGENASSDQIRRDVERVWDDVYDASRAGDGPRLCGHTTPAYARRLVAAVGGKSCADAAGRAGKLVRDAVSGDAKPRYSSFSTKGRSATIRVTLPTADGPLRNRVRFRLVGRAWKVDGESGVDSK
jgi:hypothetical protein